MGKIFRFNPLRSRIRKRRIIAILIITLPFWSWLFWYLQKPKVINIMIFDKTVPVLKRNEHRSFNWVLTHHKYVKPDKNLYDINKDYKGFFPLEPAKSEKYELHDLENFTETQIDSTADALDMFYYTDSYGVYYNEWYRHRNETEHSEYIYGGLSDNECTLIEKMVERKKLIISEFNFFASPTPYILRKRMEQLLDIRWTGWTARYFDLLDTVKNPELPRWVVKLYKEQHNYKWPFKKAGIVFVHIDNTIEILENETNLTQETPYIYTNDYAQKKYNLPHSIHYPYWMDITYSGPNNRVIS
nr:hypothetical protein [Bacteroidales bacterium]